MVRIILATVAVLFVGTTLAVQNQNLRNQKRKTATTTGSGETYEDQNALIPTDSNDPCSGTDCTSDNSAIRAAVKSAQLLVDSQYQGQDPIVIQKVFCNSVLNGLEWKKDPYWNSDENRCNEEREEVLAQCERQIPGFLSKVLTWCPDVADTKDQDEWHSVKGRLGAGVTLPPDNSDSTRARFNPEVLAVGTPDTPLPMNANSTYPLAPDAMAEARAAADQLTYFDKPCPDPNEVEGTETDTACKNGRKKYIPPKIPFLDHNESAAAMASIDADADGVRDDMVTDSTDSNANDIPDEAEATAADGSDDKDGDGIKDSHDVDIDGDGVSNGQDNDVDGDGTINALDDDINGDGVLNGAQMDADSDGKADGDWTVTEPECSTEPGTAAETKTGTVTCTGLQDDGSGSPSESTRASLDDSKCNAQKPETPTKNCPAVAAA